MAITLKQSRYELFFSLNIPKKPQPILSLKVVLLFYQTWVKIADGHFEDHSCPDVYEHIVSTLTTQDIDVVWMFAKWALRKNQEVPGCTVLTPPTEGAVAQKEKAPVFQVIK